MAQNTATHEKPTSEWEHSHALEGDETLVDTETGDRLRIEKIHSDGAVTLYDMSNGGDERHTEEEIRVSLRDGLFRTEQEGLSHELAAF